MRTILATFQRKGNPMFWPQTDRALLGCGLFVLVFLFFLLSGALAATMPAVAPHVQQPVLRQTVLFAFVMTLFWGGFAGFVWQLRRSNPESPIPGRVLVYLAGHPFVVMAYFNGVYTLSAGILLAVLPAFGFVLFENRHVMIAMLITWGEVILLAAAISFGYLQDAPLYGDPAPARVLTPAWLVMQVVVSFPLALLFLLLTRSIVNALREREAQVAEMARRDGLTGLWNRRYHQELTELEVARAKRSGHSLAVVVADLDFFKQVNDTHGHALGDEALKMAAEALSRSVRSIDHVGRFGGEEFILLLVECDEKTAMAIAERARQAVEAIKLFHGGKPIPLTASFGVAVGGGHELDADQLFRDADAALYRAKEAGRNRVAGVGERRL